MCLFYIQQDIFKKPESVFSAIKDKIGALNCRVFMSDMAESFYIAWQEVMGEADMRLFCTWHVVRPWQKNLPKIKNKEKQTQIYDQVRTLLEETDAEAFDIMIESVTRQLLEDEETREFGSYFSQHYVKNCKSWAYCHRLNAGINTNMHLESMHKTLKHLFLKGKTVKRLDKAIYAIMQLIRTKLFDRLIILEKGKLTFKLKNLRARHIKSLNLQSELVTENGDNSWSIASSSQVPQLYTVKLVQSNCNCSVVCRHCKACIHKFTCTCIDASIKWNMCKHIHLLCRTLEVGSAETTTHTSDLSHSDREDFIIEEDSAIAEKKCHFKSSWN